MDLTLARGLLLTDGAPLLVAKTLVGGSLYNPPTCHTSVGYPALTIELGPNDIGSNQLFTSFPTKRMELYTPEIKRRQLGGRDTFQGGWTAPALLTVFELLVPVLFPKFTRATPPSAS